MAVRASLSGSAEIDLSEAIGSRCSPTARSGRTGVWFRSTGKDVPHVVVTGGRVDEPGGKALLREAVSGIFTRNLTVGTSKPGLNGCLICFPVS
jgi:hypothetical protein